MPFHYRKSVSAGPFRFNFSSGGVGMSVGVKGLRIGTGPPGHYVQAGRGGFTYRASLGGGSHASAPAVRHDVPAEPRSTHKERVQMVEVTSGDVLAMEDSVFSEVLAELNQKHRQTKMMLVLPFIGVLATVVLALAFGAPAAVAGVLLVLIAAGVGAWLGQGLTSRYRAKGRPEAIRSVRLGGDDLTASVLHKPRVSYSARLDGYRCNGRQQTMQRTRVGGAVGVWQNRLSSQRFQMILPRGATPGSDESDPRAATHARDRSATRSLHRHPWIRLACYVSRGTDRNWAEFDVELYHEPITARVQDKRRRSSSQPHRYPRGRHGRWACTT